MADDLEQAGTGLLLLGIGVGLAYHGATMWRRATAWIGAATAALGAAIFLGDMSDDATLVGLLFLAAGIGIVFAGHAVAQLINEPDELVVTAAVVGATDDAQWAPPPPTIRAATPTARRPTPPLPPRPVEPTGPTATRLNLFASVKPIRRRGASGKRLRSGCPGVANSGREVPQIQGPSPPELPLGVEPGSDVPQIGPFTPVSRTSPLRTAHRQLPPPHRCRP